MEIIVSKKQNPIGDYTTFSISIDANSVKADDIIQITCPADEEKTVVEQVIKVFGHYE